MLFSGVCCVLFAIDWYLGAAVPAWMALIWCAATFIRDVEAYLIEKKEKDFIDVVKLNEEVR